MYLRVVIINRRNRLGLWLWCSDVQKADLLSSKGRKTCQWSTIAVIVMVTPIGRFTTYGDKSLPVSEATKTRKENTYDLDGGKSRKVSGLRWNLQRISDLPSNHCLRQYRHATHGGGRAAIQSVRTKIYVTGFAGCGQVRVQLWVKRVAKLSVQKQGVNVILFPQRRCLSPLVPQLQ